MKMTTLWARRMNIHGDGITNPTSKNYYAWGATINDLPVLPKKCTWKKIANMTKPGVENYSYPVYTLTERSKHGSKKQAGWALAKKAGEIAVPTAGDFDIVKKFGGDWLCEGGTVSYDGRYWVATCVYTHSPDIGGWDKDLYMTDED